ncbi:hypothetical protein LP421_08720 [Rhizobium sp. RCAM05350]|nr:hypothetical protein LP421_08720 [Rhizobium sp. RCAM05350]
MSAAKAEAADARIQAQNLGAKKLDLNKQVTSLKTALERAMADTVVAQKLWSKRRPKPRRSRRRSSRRSIWHVMCRLRRWNKASTKNAGKWRHCSSNLRIRPKLRQEL